MLATVATPAGVVLGWLAPRPLDALVAMPLVLIDIWVASNEAMSLAERPSHGAPILRVALLVLGIVLTWLLYVVVARVVLWRLLRHHNGRMDSG